MPDEESVSVPSRSKQSINTHELVKFVAIVTMVVDHVGFFYLDNEPVTRLIGRIAAPCFFFLIGYTGSRNKDYTLLIAGIILTAIVVPAQLKLQANILINFFIYRWFQGSIKFEERTNREIVLLLCILCVLEIWSSPVLEYGTVGWLWAIGGRLVAINRKHLALSAFVLAVINQGFSSSYFVNVNPLLLYLVFSACALCFYFYSLKETSLKSVWVRNIANYSLQIYFWHYLFFNLHRAWLTFFTGAV